MSKGRKGRNQNYLKVMVIVLRMFAVQKIRTGVDDCLIIDGGNPWL